MANRKDGASSRSHFWIDDLHVQPDRNIVMRGDEEIKLEKRLMQVLVEIAENNGKPVSTGALWEEFWSGEDQTGRYDENPVTKAVSVLRKKIGDDKRNPRYIRTIIKLGYCIIPKVQFAEGYRHVHGEFGTWTLGNPYVGLKPFDQGHAEVFQGRSATVADLRQAMREQIDNQRRFVLIVGPSGCGKTSLVHASMIPSIRRSGGFEGLRALSLANCDLGTASDGDLMTTLAVALTAWKVGEREIFSLYPQEHLRQMLAEAPQKVTAVIEESFRRHPIRGIDEEPHAHLLLTIDHAETLVSGRNIDPEQRSCFSRAIRALCDTPRTLTTMIARLDLYPALADALPELADYRCGYGHFEVSIPSEGELAKIIRKPAALAGVDFEEHPKTQIFLDDLLCKKAIAQPDALPLLQHTLHSLYERCGETGLLTYAAYEEIGGLEGAIARRAEEVFEGSPETTPGGRERVLERIFARVVVIQPDSGAVGTSPIIRSRLDLEADQMIQIFIDAHLFISDLDGGQPIAKIAHEALLRQWPRATEWIDENRRLLQAKGRLQRAAERWDEDGRNADHLLNPGTPLSEAQEVSMALPEQMSETEHLFLMVSQTIEHRRKRARNVAISALTILAITLTIVTTALLISLEESKESQRKSQEFSDVVFDVADDLQKTGDLESLANISESTLSTLENTTKTKRTTYDYINESRAQALKGNVLLAKNKRKQAHDAFLAAFRAAKKANDLSPEMILAQEQYGQASFWIGKYYQRQQPLTAEHYWSIYEKQYLKLHEDNPNNPKFSIELSYALDSLGTAHEAQGDPDKALSYFTKSIELKDDAAGTANADLDWKFESIVTRSRVGNIQVSTGKLVDAQKTYETSIEELEKLILRNNSAHDWKRQLASLHQLKSRLSVMQGDLDSAKEEIKKAIQGFQEISDPSPSRADWREMLAKAHYDAAEVARLRHDPAASKHLAEAEKIISSLSNNGAPPPSLHHTKAGILITRALIDGHKEKSKLFDLGVSELLSIHNAQPKDSHLLSLLAFSLISRGKYNLQQKNYAGAYSDFELATSLLSSVRSDAKDPRLIGPLAYIEETTSRRISVSDERIWLNEIGYSHPEFMPRSTPPHTLKPN